MKAVQLGVGIRRLQPVEQCPHLQVWTKNADGSDRLIAIADAGVGAIYLGHVSTEFSVNTLDTNQTQGIVRSTGVFLKESGEVGTIQHVDLVV